MPKQKDFFSELKKVGKINNPEFDKWVENLPDADIPDFVVKAHDDNFLTRERAQADKEIHGKIMADSLSPVDNDLNELFNFQLKEYLDPLTEQEIQKTGSSYKKLALLKKLVPEIIKKVKGTPQTDEDTKKKLTEYEKTIQEFTDKFTTAEKDYNSKLKSIQEESETKFHDFKLDTQLEKLGNTFTLAEAFEATRPAITKVIMSEIKGSNHLKLGEKDGKPVILVNDEKGNPRFNGNTPITVESLLEEHYKPFLKKSESDSTHQATQKTPIQSSNQKPAVRTGARTTVG